MVTYSLTIPVSPSFQFDGFKTSVCEVTKSLSVEGSSSPQYWKTFFSGPFWLIGLNNQRKLKKRLLMNLISSDRFHLPSVWSPLLTTIWVPANINKKLCLNNTNSSSHKPRSNPAVQPTIQNHLPCCTHYLVWLALSSMVITSGSQPRVKDK